MPNPTNSDIIAALGNFETKQHAVNQQLQSDVKALKEGQRYTNGKVAELFEDKIRRDERQKMAEELAAQGASPATTIKADTVVMQQKWFQNEKLVAGVVTLLLAVASVIGFVTGVNR